jgi:hypothetical protein
MKFTKRLHDGIACGDITCTIRIWHNPRVKQGDDMIWEPDSSKFGPSARSRLRILRRRSRGARAFRASSIS